MQKDLDFSSNLKIENQFIAELDDAVKLYLKREDLLHPEVSGNKFRKLKYNLLKAKEEGYSKLLTFGGAYSNHIAATAAAAEEFGFESIGVIRGEELAKKDWSENPTLKFGDSCGMKFHFISREDYRKKQQPEFLEKLKTEFGQFYLVPEGGTNRFAVKGCEEILTEEDKDFDYICCAVGTGGTVSGLINASAENQKILGFPALKGEFLSEEIKKYAGKDNWELILNYHFGGYAKVTAELVDFINNFRKDYSVQLDPVYTGKMLYSIFDLARNSYFPPNSRILAIHTGGLQGIAGMNKILQKKKLPEIEYDYEA